MLYTDANKAPPFLLLFQIRMHSILGNLLSFALPFSSGCQRCLMVGKPLPNSIAGQQGRGENKMMCEAEIYCNILQ
ncbi:hypothetical protein NC652_017194 [Populus alba x Populus x berolinensis]|nr:hypothetical protein NC652_017194 [Populus alba x Populus x berolinensis]